MRKQILTLHLLLASFMAPAFIMVAISGGLYLAGIKGSTEQISIPVPLSLTLDLESKELESDVRALLKQADLDLDFEYLRVRGSTLATRPTSRTFAEINVVEDAVSITRVEPNIQSSLMELHKGHGPGLFKTYQQLVAIALVFVMLSGLWMGLSNRMLRRKTVIAVILGSITFIVLLLS